MLRHPFIILVLILLFSSCSYNKRIIYLRTDDVTGLEIGSIAHVGGLEIGRIKEMALARDGQIIIKLEINKDVSLPSDTKFTFESRGFLGSKGVSLKIGTNKNFISESDTVFVPPGANESLSDTLSNNIQEVIENISGLKQRDSILLELRELNKKLEEGKQLKER